MNNLEGTIALLIFGLFISLLLLLRYWGVQSTQTPEEKDQIEQEIKEQFELRKNGYKNKDGIVCCPNCKSTQVQLVTRKWSPLTGFLTNKVDRVCVSCKRKF